MRRLPLWLARAFALLLLVWPEAVHARPELVVVRVEGVINPLKVRLVERALERARAERAELVSVSPDSSRSWITSPIPRSPRSFSRSACSG